MKIAFLKFVYSSCWQQFRESKYAQQKWTKMINCSTFGMRSLLVLIYAKANTNCKDNIMEAL